MRNIHFPDVVLDDVLLHFFYVLHSCLDGRLHVVLQFVSPDALVFKRVELRSPCNVMKNSAELNHSKALPN